MASLCSVAVAVSELHLPFREARRRLLGFGFGLESLPSPPSMNGLFGEADNGAVKWRIRLGMMFMRLRASVGKVLRRIKIK